jgi:hypothetical protein
MHRRQRPENARQFGATKGKYHYDNRHLNRGGGGGIRTRDTVSRIHTFQACAFSRSATPPFCAFGRKQRAYHRGRSLRKPTNEAGANNRRLEPCAAPPNREKGSSGAAAAGRPAAAHALRAP